MDSICVYPNLCAHLQGRYHYHSLLLCEIQPHNPHEINPELSLGFCACPHLCKQNFRKVISTFALGVTIKAVFESHLGSEPQLGFPGSFLTWKGWYKGKLLGYHPYNSPLNPMPCCLPSDASPFVLTSAVSARSLTLTEHLPRSLLPSF